MAEKATFFDVVDHGDPQMAAPAIQPWKVVPLDPDYSGAWVVAGDINQDGKAEIISARNVNHGDIHYTSAVAAHDLDGRVLWRWGDPTIGRRGLHHDVACQIHDWDGDGRNEVVLCTEGWIVELDGTTGAERRRLPLPLEATDCLVFANLSGRSHASEALVKTRYSQIWAMDYSGKTLWTVQRPGGFLTAHQPVAVDIDGDGRDEIMAGYALLSHDGQIRWTLHGHRDFPGRGHLDCCRILRRGNTPAECRLALTCCGDLRLMVINGLGEVQWELGGHHFESIDVGRVHPERPGLQLLVDLTPYGAARDENELWLVDESGEFLGRIQCDYCRFHTLVDWNGDGYDEMVSPYSRGLFDSRGKRIGTFAMDAQKDVFGGKPAGEGEIGHIVLGGDMNGDGVRDVVITAPDAVYVFANGSGRRLGTAVPLGSGPNFTLY